MADTWDLIGNVINGEATGDGSGGSVSMSADGSIVAIGATSNDGNGNNSGHVRVYALDSGTSTWVQMGQDIDGEAADDLSGWSVSMSASGSIVAIGAVGNDGNGSGSNSGHVRVYEYNGTTWIKLGQDIDGEATGNVSGWAVSISASGSIVAIGAIYNDGKGHTRVYEYNGTAWVQIGQDIDGEATGDASGWAVSISASGSIVAIGAVGNDGNGGNSGHVRVYENISGTWVQIGQDIDGEAADDLSFSAGDNSGHSVSISADGSIVAIGAIYMMVMLLIVVMFEFMKY